MSNSRVIIVLCLSILSAMLGVGIIAPLLPLYAESMGATGIWIGVIYAAFSISRAAFMPIVGKFSDRKGRKLFISIGLFLYVVISLCYTWADTPQKLMVVRLIHGLGGTMIIPIAMAYMGELAPRNELGKYMGYFNTSLFLGFGLGFILGGFLTHWFGMNIAFYAMGAICLAVFFAILLLLPELHLYQKRDDNSELSLRRIIESNVGKALITFRISNSMARGIFSCFIPIFGGLKLGLDTAQIGMLLAVNTLLAGFLQVPFGKLADKLSKKNLVATGNLVDMLFLLLIPHMHSFSQLLILCFVLSVGRPIAIPAASAMAAMGGRKFGMGASMGIFSMAMSVGMAIGSPLGGLICDWVNLNSVFYFAAAAELLGTVIFLWLMKNPKNS